MTFDDSALLARIADDDDLGSASYSVARALAGLQAWPLLTSLPPVPETAHLRTITRHRDMNDVVVYAEFLSEHGYLAAAQTFLLLVPSLDADGLILLATVYRKLGLFYDAEQVWDRVDILGYQLKDRALELKALQGRGIIARHKGNLPWSLTLLDRVLEDATDFPEITAECQVNRGMVLALLHKPVDAALAFWAGYRVAKGEHTRWSAYSSVGISLKDSGHWRGAAMAFRRIIAECPDWGLVTNAMIEALDLASLQNDGPQRYHLLNELNGRAKRMPPSMKCDYLTRLGIVASRLHDERKASHWYAEALSVAEEYGLNVWVMRLDGLAKAPPTLPIEAEDERLVELVELVRG